MRNAHALALVATVVSGLAVVLQSACRTPQAPVRVARSSSPSTLDPHLHNELSAWSLLSNFYDALVAFSPRMVIEPSLATDWEWMDTTHVRFTLRSDVVFHDGSRFGARDVVASFERARSHPRSGSAHHLVGIRRMVAESDGSLLIETNGPAPTLLNRLAFLFVVPASQIDVPEISQPTGTGPYRFGGRTDGGAFVAEAWEGWHARPPVPRVEFLFPSEEERLQGFIDGSLDVASNLPDGSLADLRGIPGRRVLPQPQLAVRYVVVIPRAAQGTVSKALTDPRVRRAMVMALDRDTLADGVFQGSAVVATQYVHPSVFGFDPTISPIPYDQAEAGRLLREAGFPDGFDLPFAHGDVNPELIRYLVEDWLAVGVRAQAVELPFPDVMRAAREERYPLVMLSRIATTGDASEILDSMFHTRAPAAGLGGENYGDYTDDVFDQLDEAAAAEINPQRRLELLQRAQRRALETLPILPLVVLSTHVGVSDRLDIVIRFDDWTRADGFRWR